MDVTAMRCGLAKNVCFFFALVYIPNLFIFTFGQVNVLKPSHKSTLQSKMIETPVPDSVSAVHNATNATRDVESEFEAGQEGKIREIVMDNIDSEPMVCDMIEFGLF